MPVFDEEKKFLKEDFYDDERLFRSSFLRCIKHDDVQRGLFAAVVKGAIWWIFGIISVSLIIIASHTYFNILKEM